MSQVGVRLLLFLGAFRGFVFAGPPARSVVLISVDTLRADHLGCYGYRKVSTPHIDRLAREGIVFSQVDSPVPMTLPAHTSLLSSTYPFVHGVEENGQQVSSRIVTLATVLQASGYRTGAFIGGYVLDARFGLNRGFDAYDSPFHLRPDAGEEPPEIKRLGDAVLGAADHWIAAGAGKPFFAFIHLYDAHQPYSHGSYTTERSLISTRLWETSNTRSRRGGSCGILLSSSRPIMAKAWESTGRRLTATLFIRAPCECP